MVDESASGKNAYAKKRRHSKVEDAQFTACDDAVIRITYALSMHFAHFAESDENDTLQEPFPMVVFVCPYILASKGY